MAETSTPKPVIKRECSCGKKDGEIDTCQLCLEYRSQQLPQNDSFIFAALKLAIVEAFFKQQTYYQPGGQYQAYGGQAVEMVKKIMEREDFKQMMVEITNVITSMKDDWEKMAINIMTPYIEQRGRDMVNSWDLKDGMYSVLSKAALDHAKKMFEDDIILKEKIAKAVNSQKYTVELDVRVKIVEERTPQ